MKNESRGPLLSIAPPDRFFKGSFQFFFQEIIVFAFEFSHLGGYLVYSAPRKRVARVVNKLLTDCCQVAGNRRNFVF